MRILEEPAKLNIDPDSVNNMAKAYVYIDGFNLYYGVIKDSHYRWLDLGAFCERMLPGTDIACIKYFTAEVNAGPYDPDHPTPQQVYLRALKTIPNLKIYLEPFGTATEIRRRLFLMFSSHLLFDGCKKLHEVTVIVSNDSDLCEPVRMVRTELNMNVGILNPHQSDGCTMGSNATFVKRIRQSDVAACQFPDPLHDAKGEIRKPPTW
jgi:hypothetical protein